MSEIDWSKAPEGATHARNCGWENPDWYKIVDGVLMVHSCNEGWDESGYSDMGEVPNLQTRPAKAWTGTGLPPVGTVCEMQHSVSGIDSDWIMVKINYCSPHNTVATSIDGGIEFVAFTRRSQFRPIRTPEQIEAEEREKAIDAICYDICLHYGNPKGSEHYLNLATKLHDLGYRKQGEAK